MQGQPLELSETSLSPSEYTAYHAYISQLSAPRGAHQAIGRSALRQFAISRLAVPPNTADDLLHRVATSSTSLTSRQVFAFLRLAAHAKLVSNSVLHKGRPVDVQMLLVPVAPLPIDPNPTTISHQISQAVPDSNNNPFLRKPPPLPPRKPSQAEKLTSSPTQASSSSSSILSGYSNERYSPTKRSAPSSLIRVSLSAAAEASTARKHEAPTIHVLHGTTSSAQQNGSPGLANRKLISQVQQAVREVDESLPLPPQRKPSGRSCFEDRVRESKESNPDVVPWSCVDLLSGQNSARPYAMIILNQPITRKDVFVRAWRASEVHLCADGGANRLYDIWNADQRASYTPTMIKGDLDSIRSDVKAYYSASGVPVKYDGDQYATDLMKCIREVEAIEKATGRQLSLLFMGGLSGRIDQTVHTMSLLHKLRKTRPSSFVLSGESLAWVLDEGSHLIEIDHATMGETCGILPVGIDKAMVHTEGLKWDLNWITSFDGQISTSNHLVPSEPVVRITTDRPILWCIEVRPNLGQSSPTNRVRTRSSYGPEELKRDIRGLSMGVARTAEDVGKDLLRVGRG